MYNVTESQNLALYTVKEVCKLNRSEFGSIISKRLYFGTKLNFECS